MNRVLDQGNHAMVARVGDEGCARLDEIAFELLYEDHASAGERALIGDLLVKGFGWRHRPMRLATALRRRSTVRERGYTLHPPYYRVLAWAGDQLVGARMVCRPSCEPPGVYLYGFGDAAVHPAWRRRGIARAMTRLAVEEAERQGAGVMLTSTTTLEPVYRAFGFRPVRERYEVRLDDDSGHTFHRTWLIRWTVEPTPIVLHSEF
jgi:GNAT superfamily N-acetyltransferase